MRMGCIASIAADRKNSKVQPVPSLNTLRGDLISRDEARNRRNKSVTDRHAKANKLAQTMAYNTLAEKEMMSTTSTERSYRSGRGFLINSAMNGSTNASERGSSSTLSEGSDQPTLNARNKTENAKSSLPFAVPEEETSRNSSLKGLQDTKDQLETQASDVNGYVPHSMDNKCEDKSPETNSQSNLNIHEHVKGHEDDSKASQKNNEKEKRHVRVRFNDSPTEVKVEEVRDSENERTDVAGKQNGSVGSGTSPNCQSAG
ncbi:uncharacterized protein [Asterias amurensis]|uniref:uncharacterized protein n=1 Tax=Asterias amurensis TaxID=7602 RepID=UPI003AB38436